MERSEIIKPSVALRSDFAPEHKMQNIIYLNSINFKTTSVP